MKKNGFYSSGEFARMAQVSVRTIRFYDKQNILKPSLLTEAGARFYTDSDFIKLQQILLLKYLGFSLDEIKTMTIDNTDYHFLLNHLSTQRKLVTDKIEQMQLVEEAIDNTISAIEKEQQIDWHQMLNLIHLTGMEKSLKSNYENANNISARIRLHKDYSTNPQGWWNWIYDDVIFPLLKEKEEKNPDAKLRILELGCGDGSLWRTNISKIPSNIEIILSDISEGMLRDARRNMNNNPLFAYECFDCQSIPYEANSFDMVIANHLLFYCDRIPSVCREVRRILKPEGAFLCSTYSEKHMHEITDLVQSFDPRIILSAEKLYEHFGLSNGFSILEPHFSSLELLRYEDGIQLSNAEPIIEYILSCHGNQNQYLLDRYQEFKQFVERKVKNNYYITKDAGVFVCRSL